MMNMMSLVFVAIVAFTYFGGQNVPKVLKDNKQMILGVFVGVLLHQFMGVGVEGIASTSTGDGPVSQGLQLSLDSANYKEVTINEEIIRAQIADNPEGRYCKDSANVTRNPQNNVLQCNVRASSEGEEEVRKTFTCPEGKIFNGNVNDGYQCQ